jgi:hypothetical protein
MDLKAAALIISSQERPVAVGALAKKGKSQDEQTMSSEIVGVWEEGDAWHRCY